MIRPLLFLLFALPAIFPLAAGAVSTQVSTGVYYYPADAKKVTRAELERAEDGLEFRAPRPPRDVARELADKELRNGNVCLRQVRRDLQDSLKEWRVRELCKKIFDGALEAAVNDAAKKKLHADHFECNADVEAREQGASLTMTLVFRGAVVMKEKVPSKLKRAGIEGELARWDLPVTEEPLGATSAGWKAALKSGACSADKDALERFSERLDLRAQEAKELALCRKENEQSSATIADIQKQLRDYVPEDWVKEALDGERAKWLSARPAPSPGNENLAECRKLRAAADQQLESLRWLSTKIASKHDVPALDPDREAARRSPASVDENEEP